jgi:dTDP-4-dehydrorhamnose reductase
VGVIKQLPAAKAPIPSISINALFPHRLAQLCQACGARLVHVSTDCVFSGRKGRYTEDDPSDAEDLYGRTKFLGEVAGPGCLTLRTSIIGRELDRRTSLIEWFLSQRGRTVTGYARAIYTGLTTRALSELIGDILERHPDMSGLWHAASDPISKYDLLELVNRALSLGITLQRDESLVCDRSLDSTRLRKAIGYQPPSWPEMVRQLAGDA